MFEPPPSCSGGKNYANILWLKKHNVCNPQKPRITKGRISHNRPSFHCPEWPPIHTTRRSVFPLSNVGWFLHYLETIIKFYRGHYIINSNNALLLMEEILHQLIGSLSQCLQGFIHPRWCKISSINSITMENASNLTYLCILWSHQHGSHWMTPLFFVPLRLKRRECHHRHFRNGNLHGVHASQHPKSLSPWPRQIARGTGTRSCHSHLKEVQRGARGITK